MSIIGSIIRRVVQRQGRKFSLPEWQQQLEKSGEVINGRYQASSTMDKNHQLGRHIIGIERWSQSRLRVFLGAELVIDEYDSYQPAADIQMADLGQLFAETRQETLALVVQLQNANIADDQLVPHNDMGEINVRSWLAYINGHGLRESSRLK